MTTPLGQVPLEAADVLGRLPDVAVTSSGGIFCLQVFRVHADDQRFLVVASVEDADGPGRRVLHASPEVVVVEVLGDGDLKEVTWQPTG